MRIISIVLALVLLLSGCIRLREHEYVVVEPHDEGYEVAVDTGKLSVDSYLSLKNALLNLIEDGVQEGVILAKGYSGNLAEDLGEAVYEVSQGDPLGAFAVEYMTYDYSKIVSYYEIRVHITFRRTEEEIDSIVYLSDEDSIPGLVNQTLKDLSDVLCFRVSDYHEMDYAKIVEEISGEYPGLLMAMPEVTAKTYPETGSQRIVELAFDYPYKTDSMLSFRDQLSGKVHLISELYGSDLSELTTARRFYDRLIRDGELILEPQESIDNTAYSAVMLSEATSYGYAQAFRMLLQERELPCQVVTGTRNGLNHSWCLVVLEGKEYYIDPALGVEEPDTDWFLLGTTELLALGYESDDTSLPYVELLPTEKSSQFIDPYAP